MVEVELKPGWLDRQLRRVSEDVKAWPGCMREAAGFEEIRMKKEKTQFETAVADCFNGAEGVYPGETDVTITFSDNRVTVIASRMYEYLPLGFDVLKRLAVVFGTENFEVNNWSNDGCETCDYGSKYAHEFSFVRDTPKENA